jgi:primary-amine oxidase
MVVPYGDPSKTWSWRNAFDVGEYNLGMSLTPLRPGHEVPENATLLPVTLVGDMGQPFVFKRGLAIYEQDGGLLWTHSVHRRRSETRRARQLVLHVLYTVGNYDYGLRWIFGQDGSIEVQVELTGVMLVRGVKTSKCVVCEQQPDADGRLRPQGPERHGSLVAPQIVATHHQHFFNFRLDFDVDGEGNSVHEMDLVSEAPLPSNPERNAFVLEQRVLRSEREARCNLDSGRHRTWKVLNPNRKTALGHFPAYELVPGANGVPLAHPESRIRKRAGFTSHHLWVTRFKPRERYAAGDYPNQSAGGEGLPRYSDDNEPLVDTDVVLWYTMGLAHAARAEEWPVMPVNRAGFRLVPHNFFDRNPALDVR